MFKKIARIINIQPSEGEEYFFKHNPAKPNFNFVEYSGEFSNTGKMNKIPSLRIQKFDTQSLVYKDTENRLELEEIYNAEKLNEFMGMNDKIKFLDLYKSIGYKEGDVLLYVKQKGIEAELRDLIRGNQKLNIVIQGLCTEKLWANVHIVFPKGKLIEMDSLEKVTSGRYIVTKVIDKIISGVFTQILTLESADYPRGDEDVWK